MEITHEQVDVLWDTLEFSSFHPPREAVAELFALAAPADPQNVYVSAAWAGPAPYSGATAWTIVALAADGLAVVTATAPEQWDWAAERHKGSPEGRHVDARWIRLNQVHGLTVKVSEIEPSSPDRNNRGLRYRETWTLQVIGKPPLELTDDHSTAGPIRVRTFVDRLRSALGAARIEETQPPTTGAGIPEVVVELQQPDA